MIRRWLPWMVALIVGGQVFLALVLPKSISWDPSYGLLAAQHYLHGRSPDLLHVAEADRDHLEKDKFVERGYWAPGYQVLPWLLRFGGALDWGGALKLTIGLCLAAGLTGWGLYFRRVSGTWQMTTALLLLLACSRYVWIFTITYAGGDLLLWAAAPWLVLLNVRALPAARPWLPLLAGAASSSVFLLKYSGLFLAIGLGGLWLFLWWRRRVEPTACLAWLIGTGAVAVIIRCLGFPAKGHAGAMPVKLEPLRAALSLGFPVTGATDAESLVIRVLAALHVEGTEWTPAMVGFGLLLVVAGLLWLCRSRNASHALTSDPAALAGLAVCVADVLGLAALICLGGNIAPQARLGRIAGLFLLPVLARFVVPSAERNGRLPRLALALLLGLPAAYGVMAGVPKLAQAWKYRRSAVGPDGISCLPLAAATPHDAFFQELTSKLPSEEAVLLVPFPQLAFAVPQRRCILFDGVTVLGPELIAKEKWRGHPPAGLALLLPRAFEGDARLLALQKVFFDVPAWQMLPMKSDGEWALWIAK